MIRLFKRTLFALAGLVTLITVVGSSYHWYASRRDLAETPAPGWLVDVGGHRLHLWCVGEKRAGAPVVFFDSGLGGDSFSWAKIAPEVGRFTQACTYDRAGVGYSDPGPMPRTSAQIAAELRTLIRRSDFEPPVILVGSSFGGYNTRLVASEAPELVAGLVLVSASHESQGERYEQVGIPSGKPPKIMVKFAPILARLGWMRMSGVTFGPPPGKADPSVRPFAKATVHRSSRFQAMASELEHTRQSGRQVAAARRVLEIPLVVLTPGAGEDPRAEINRELQHDMTTLSDRACQVIAEDSRHGLGNRPDLVIQAIRDVIDAAGQPGARPGC